MASNHALVADSMATETCGNTNLGDPADFEAAFGAASEPVCSLGEVAHVEATLLLERARWRVW